MQRNRTSENGTSP